MVLIWGIREAKYFCARDWTTQITLNRLGKLDFARMPLRRFEPVWPGGLFCNSVMRYGNAVSPQRHCEELLRRSNPSCRGESFCGAMDCFAEPVIGPRFARTRWLAMTGKSQ
jgi:hypothetical protein